MITSNLSNKYKWALKSIWPNLAVLVSNPGPDCEPISPPFFTLETEVQTARILLTISISLGALV